MDKKIFKPKNIIFVITIFLLSIVYAGTSNAAVFNVYTEVCAPSWYCTAYDHGDCGTRACIDTNGCGNNFNRPTEYLKCKSSSSGGGGGSGYVSTTPPIGIPPEGYFTVNSDMIKVTIEQGVVVQKIITINSSEPAKYHLEIQYPSSYTRGTDFVSTTSDTKQIKEDGDFNIIIDSREILAGTYVIPIKIYNDNYSKIIGLTIDVIPSNNPEIEIILDSNIKKLGVDTKIFTFVKVKGLQTDDNTTVTYTILDPKGGIISTEDKRVDDISKVEHEISLPTTLGEGYYTLSVKIAQKSETYVKSEQFTVLTPNRYMPIVENPEKIMTLWIWIAIIIASAVILFNTGLFYKSYKSSYRIKGRLSKLKVPHRPGTGIREKIAVMLKKSKDKTDEKIIDINHKIELLKKSYEDGFISAKEYHDIAKRYGYNIEISDASEERMTDKEAVEAAIRKHSEDEGMKNQKVWGEKKIPISLSNAINIPIEKEGEPEKIFPENKTSIKEPEEIIPKTAVEEKKNIFESPETERPVSGNSISSAISHMFAQNIIDRKVQYDQAFVLNNNERLYSIRDLIDSLQDMPEHFFEHHTKYGRNDFSNWIGDVFQYYDIAEAIRDVKTKEELAEILKRYAYIYRIISQKIL